MKTLHVQDLYDEKILVSRESAHRLEDRLRTVLLEVAQHLESSPRILTVDFEGVFGVAPSFLDELLKILESLLDSRDHDIALVIVNLPTRLSLKFEAIARGHGMSAESKPDGSWVLSAANAPSA